MTRSGTLLKLAATAAVLAVLAAVAVAWPAAGGERPCDRGGRLCRRPGVCHLPRRELPPLERLRSPVGHGRRHAGQCPRRLRQREVHAFRRHLDDDPAGRPLLHDHRRPGRPAANLRRQIHLRLASLAAVSGGVPQRPRAMPARGLGHGREAPVSRVWGRAIPSGDVLHWTRPLQNWNYMCAECHTTDLQRKFDLPATLARRRSGVPAGQADTYHTTFREINVSCETCHGPGSVHGQWAHTWRSYLPRSGAMGLPFLKSDNPRIEIETCAPATPGGGSSIRASRRAKNSSTTTCPRCSTPKSTIPTARSATRTTNTAPSCRARCTVTRCAAPTATIRTRCA